MRRVPRSQKQARQTRAQGLRGSGPVSTPLVFHHCFMYTKGFAGCCPEDDLFAGISEQEAGRVSGKCRYVD